MTDRDNAQNTAAATNTEEDWKLYRRLRNFVNKSLKNEKHNWQMNRFKTFETEHDCKQIWKNIKTCLNWTTSGSPSQLFHDGKLETQPTV